MPDEQLILHSLIAKHGTLALDIELGDDLHSIELGGNKIQACFDHGLDARDIAALVGGRYMPGVCYLPDIESQGADQDTLMEEADRLFGLALLVGAKAAQVITGPISIEPVAAARDGRRSDSYSGLLGKPLDEQMRLTAQNFAIPADRAARYGLMLNLERLSGTRSTRSRDNSRSSSVPVEAT